MKLSPTQRLMVKGIGWLSGNCKAVLLQAPDGTRVVGMVSLRAEGAIILAVLADRPEALRAGLDLSQLRPVVDASGYADFYDGTTHTRVKPAPSIPIPPPSIPEPECGTGGGEKDGGDAA